MTIIYPIYLNEADIIPNKLYEAIGYLWAKAYPTLNSHEREEIHKLILQNGNVPSYIEESFNRGVKKANQ